MFSMCIPRVFLKRGVTQIFNLGISSYFTSKIVVNLVQYQINFI